MRCQETTCSIHHDCGILDILKKIPIGRKCSYFVKSIPKDRSEIMPKVKKKSIKKDTKND